MCTHQFQMKVTIDQVVCLQCHNTREVGLPKIDDTDDPWNNIRMWPENPRYQPDCAMLYHPTDWDH